MSSKVHVHSSWITAATTVSSSHTHTLFVLQHTAAAVYREQAHMINYFSSTTAACMQGSRLQRCAANDQLGCRLAGQTATLQQQMKT
jgi:hypothetical protein